MPHRRDEIDATGLLRTVAARRYPWSTPYTADDYVQLLETYSGHRALDAESRRRLYGRIHGRIERRPSRRVELTLLATLNVAGRI